MNDIKPSPAVVKLVSDRYKQLKAEIAHQESIAAELKRESASLEAYLLAIEIGEPAIT